MEAIQLDLIKILVMQCTCSARNIKIMNLLKESLAKTNIKNVRVFEGGYSDIDYWDSTKTIIFSSVPLISEVKAHVEVVMNAYLGFMSQEEFDIIFNRSIKSIGEETVA